MGSGYFYLQKRPPGRVLLGMNVKRRGVVNVNIVLPEFGDFLVCSSKPSSRL